MSHAITRPTHLGVAPNCDLLHEIDTLLADTALLYGQSHVTRSRGDLTLRSRRMRGYLLVARIRAETGHEAAALELIDRSGLDCTAIEFHN